VTFLRANEDATGLVTLDIGFDDIRPCLEHETADSSCLDAAIHVLGGQLRTIVGALSTAAGPDVHLLGIGAYDPYLADWGDGADGQAFALASEQAMTRVNHEMARAYGEFGVPMVDVATAFGQHLDDASSGALAEEADRTCVLTWMCSTPPYGPNFHPNDDGYRVIAEAIESALTGSGL
jgi:lysophospholipase L1-like esterase